MARPNRIPIPLGQRLDDLRRGPLQVLIWVGTAVGAFLLIERQSAEYEFLGLARALEAEVSADVDGRLAEVLVEPFEDVAAQQVIARLDDSLVLARIEAAMASIDALSARTKSERARLAQALDRELRDRTSELRRYLVDEQDRRLARLGVEVQIEADLVERDRLDLRVLRTRELVKDGIATEAELEDLTLRRARFDTTVSENRALAAALSQAEEAAASRRREYEAQAPGPADEDPWLAPILAEVRSATLGLEEIRVSRRSLTLTAPFAGRVSGILAHQGQGLLAGEPVATVASPHASELLAFLPQETMRTLRPGTRVMVSRLDDTARTAEALVTRVGPLVEQLPARLWRDPTRPEYGRSVLIAGVDGLELTPGEIAWLRPLD